MSYWQFSAFHGHLRLTTGGSEYDPAVGSDSYSRMEWSIQPSEKSEYNDVWDEQWMVPESRYYPESRLNINLSSGNYEFSVEDEENELLGDCESEDEETN